MNGRLYAYTDGSTFRANPGPISWAVVFVRDDRVALLPDGRERIEVGAHHHGTNNRAELMGIIRALESETIEDMTVVSDSMVTIRCAKGEFRRNANLDLWERFDAALELRRRRGLRTGFQHVKGHHVNPHNRLADRLASAHAAANFELVQSIP